MKFECCDFDGEKWTGKLEKFIRHEEYYELFITGRGSRLHAVIGEAEYGTWICFPELDYGYGISYLDDFYWNTDKMSNGLGIIDAVTVASCLKAISQQ